ncbi:MAG: calcium/sodium antiporter [Candidatus Woesearchaeota archaeon]
MALLVDFILFFIFAFVLARSSIWVIRSLGRISSFMRISEFTAGFVILALATTLPELFVGINAALNKAPALSLGNVIGSNIVNLTLVLGIAILVGRGILVESKIIRRDAFYMLLIASLPVLLMLDGRVSRFDGFILLFAFLVYMLKMLKERKMFEKPVNHYKPYGMFNSFGLFVISMILLIISSNFLVKFAVNISRDLNVAPILIGLFLVAIGTSLPELVLGIRGVLADHKDLVMGDIIGSVVVNSTLVLGVTALIFPIIANYTLFITSAFFMMVACLLFLAFVNTDTKLTIREGVILLMLYVGFIIVEIGLNVFK